MRHESALPTLCPLSSPRRGLRLAAFALAAAAVLDAAPAQGTPPPLLSPVAQPSAQAQTWEAAERARSPMIAATQFVRVDVAALRRVPVLGAPPLMTFQLDLFAQSFLFDVERVQWTLGYQVFTGAVRGHEGSVQLTVAGDGTTFGMIDVDGASWILAWATDGDVHVLQQIDQSLLPAHMGCGTDHTFAVAAPATTAGGVDGNSDCGKTTIDLLVFYTPLARQNAGGTAAIEAAIVGAVAQANTGHGTSGVPVEFRLVYTAETNYAELGTSTDLSRFRSSTDGYMDEVHTARATYGGDLMQLVTDPASPSYCGIGYLMTNLSTGFASSAFAVTVRTCIANQSFTHECGHNMGCHHDQANAGAALYPYSYGYRTPDSAYRTIMAYAPGSRINRWSSPNVQYLGYTMGNAGTEDNALSLTNARQTVSQFFATQAPVWCDLNGGVPGALGLPTLTGRGTINLLSPLLLTARNYAAPTIGLLVIGGTEINVPAFGGLLVPSPDVTLTLVGSTSEVVHDASWLANLSPGTEVWFQAAFLDPAAAAGLAASNAVKVTVP